LIYLDDIFSANLEDHIKQLEKVFTRMREANLTLKPSKCEYLQEQVRTLGCTVSGEGLCPEEGKLTGIEKFPTPKKTKELQSFLGLCNFYRKFIKNCSVIARPYTKPQKKQVSLGNRTRRSIPGTTTLTSGALSTRTHAQKT